MTESMLTKTCKLCNTPKPITEYYGRQGFNPPINSSQCLTRCKSCMKQTAAEYNRLPAHEARAYSEQLAMTYLASHGIPALPGKAYKVATLDILAWGCVRIEVKYSSIHATQNFHFGLSNRQKLQGYLADVVLLICDYSDSFKTYHFFSPNDPVFYINGQRKVGFGFTPGQQKQLKHMATRVSLTQPIMDAAQDRVDMIEAHRVRVGNDLRNASVAKQLEIIAPSLAKAA